MNRRGLLGLGAGLLAMPALVHAGVLMPGKPTGRLVRFAVWREQPFLSMTPGRKLVRCVELHPVDARDVGRVAYQLRPGFWMRCGAGRPVVPRRALIGGRGIESLAPLVRYPEGWPIFPDAHAKALAA